VSSAWSPQRRLDVAVAANFLAIGILNAAIPRFVREELGGTGSQVGLATTIFFFAALFTRPLVGRWMDRIGRLPFLRWTVVAMALLDLSLLAVGSVWAVVAVRFAQGVFGSTYYTACAAASTDLAPPERRASAVARLSLVIYMGFAIGPSIGEFLVDRGPNWAWAAAITLHGLAFAASFLIPETRPVPVAGAVAPRVAFTALMRIVAKPGAAQFTAGLGYSCVVAFLPAYSREIGLGSSGGLFFAYAVSALVVRVFIGGLADRHGYLAVAIPGLMIFAVGHLVLAIAWTLWMPFVGVVLAGFGFGATFPALTALSVARAPDVVRAAALGVFLSFNDFGNAIAGPVVGAISDAFGFRWSYGAPALVAAVGALIAMSLRRDARAAPVGPVPLGSSPSPSRLGT
jgi:MFS family permease